MKPQEFYKFDSKPLGQGGYATVLRATHKQTGMVVALKRRRSRDRECVVRLQREIDVLRELKHQHIIPLLESSPLGDWYTMPIAEGTLESLRKQLTDGEIVQALQQVGMGLAFAHERGFIHRDVTPRNILAFRTEDGGLRWVLSDWGLVRRPRGQTSRRVTQPGTGTLEFLAPEAWDDLHKVDARADLYSLGRVAAWAATRKRLIPNVQLVPDGFWKTFVQRTTETEPDDRPRTVLDALSLLEGAVESFIPIQALVWHEDAQQRLVTSWLEVDGEGTRVLAKLEGILVSEGEQLWRWRTSARNVLFPVPRPLEFPKSKWRERFQDWGAKLKSALRPEDESEEQPPPQWEERALEDAHLDNVIRRHSQQLSPLGPLRYAEENHLERETRVIASMGRLLFILAREYTYSSGAAHGNWEFSFYVIDAETGARVETLSAPEIEPFFAEERKGAIEHFRAANGDVEPDMFSPDEVSLTLYRPFYDESGRLMFELQFTAPIAYGGSDGKWTSYTHSTTSTTSRVPDAFREFMSPPGALARYLTVTCASKRVGWSLVGANPAVRTWLAEMSHSALSPPSKAGL